MQDTAVATGSGFDIARLQPETHEETVFPSQNNRTGRRRRLRQAGRVRIELVIGYGRRGRNPTEISLCFHLGPGDMLGQVAYGRMIENRVQLDRYGLRQLTPELQQNL